MKAIPTEPGKTSIVQADGEITVVIPKLKDKNDKELTAVGTFKLDLTGKDLIKDFSVALKEEVELDNLKIPGIEKIRVINWALDLKTFRVDIGLFADAKLGAALPFLADGKEIFASLYFNLGDEPEQRFNLVLPTEIETKLFGRWPASITAMAVRFDGGDNSDKMQLRFRARIDLGLPALSSIGANIILFEKGDSWELDITLDSVGVDLDIGDMKVMGEFDWESLPEEGGGDKPPFKGAVDPELLAKAGAAREVYAALKATGGLFGDGWTMVGKSGNKDGLTYWVGAVQIDADFDLPLGSVQLSDPALLISYNADIFEKASQGEGLLKKSFGDVTKVTDKKLRPQYSDNAEVRKWLKAWKPSADIGTLVAASGYFHANNEVLSDKSKVSDENKKRQLTSLAYSDQGMFRVDASAFFMGWKKTRFALTIDTKKKYVEAGFQLPKIAYPKEDNPKYVISPGFVSLGTSYGGKPRFKLSVGWPERTGGDDFERDWSRATQVKIDDLKPINTFWGGYKAELDTGEEYIRFGYAIRAGWTKSYEVFGGSIANARAELGVTLGGVLEFEVGWGDNENKTALDPVAPRLVGRPYLALLDQTVRMRADADEAVTRNAQAAPNSASLAAQADRIAASLAVLEESAMLMASTRLELTATLYGDIWGSASVEFLGVRLASISVRAYARFHVLGTALEGIVVMKASVGFEVSVEIMCVRYRTTARIDVVLRDESSKAILAPRLAPGLGVLMRSAGAPLPALNGAS